LAAAAGFAADLFAGFAVAFFFVELGIKIRVLDLSGRSSGGVFKGIYWATQGEFSP
jgi:hypothetical protein